MSRRGGNWDACTGGAVVGAAAANRRKQDEIIRQQRLGLAQDAEQARRALISELDDLIERLHERGADATVGDYFAHLAYALTDLEAALRAASFKKEKALMKRVSPGSIYFVIDPLKGYAADYPRISQSLGAAFHNRASDEAAQRCDRRMGTLALLGGMGAISTSPNDAGRPLRLPTRGPIPCSHRSLPKDPSGQLSKTTCLAGCT
jgi:hypothetical protein